MTADSNASASPPASGDGSTEAIARRDSYRLRPGRLGAIAIAFFVISAAAPLTGMAGGAPVAMLLGNGAGVPSAYLIVTLVMLTALFFSGSYVAPYGTPLGQAVLVSLLAAFAGVLLWMKRMTVAKPMPRFLGATARSR